jgi:hypothetical protein
MVSSPSDNTVTLDPFRCDTYVIGKSEVICDWLQNTCKNICSTKDHSEHINVSYSNVIDAQTAQHVG